MKVHTSILWNVIPALIDAGIYFRHTAPDSSGMVSIIIDTSTP